MKIAIIGAGVSGLSIAQLLKEENEVTLFESHSRPGGLIRCNLVNGHLFHRTGGHVFNTKRQDVNDWFWQLFDKEHEFRKAERNSTIAMNNGQFIPYPIENHAYLLDEETLKSIVKDLTGIARQEHLVPRNFEEFLKYRFGETLYRLYFQPYNYKIWRRDLTQVPLSWLEGKLPMPTVEEIIYNNIHHVKEKAFVHSSFYYPRKGGSQFLADRLAEGVNIRYNSPIERIEKTTNGWRLSGEEFDKLIFCGNIKQLPHLLPEYAAIDTYRQAIDELESHGTTAVFCEIEKNDYSWIYLPDSKHEAHRIICSGNFSQSNNATEGVLTASIEFTDFISEAAILENLKKIPYRPKYLAHHYEPFTYPIQNSNTQEMIGHLKAELCKDHLYLLGRFAEWEYYNMDVAMGAALDLKNKKLF